MKIGITARHCELDPEVRIHAQQRLERLAHFLRDPDELMEAHVVFASEKYRQSAEVTLKTRRFGELFSREEASDARAAIELVGERLEHQLLKLKSKRKDLKRAGGGIKAINGAANGVPAGDEAEGVPEFDATEEPRAGGMERQSPGE
jgi:ribosomal subunit interface protein